MDTKNYKSLLLGRFVDLDLELILADFEYAKEYLEEEGFNTNDEIQFSEKYLAKVRFKAKAMMNKNRDLKLLDVAFERLKATIAENVSKANETLINILHIKTPNVQFRKLESWSDEEIRQVLADVDLVKLLEELSSNEEQ